MNKTKLLIICETIDFQNFTRRATIEAIAKTGKFYIEALMNTNLKNYNKINKRSDFLRVRCLYYFLVKKFREKPIGNIEMKFLKKIWKQYFDKFNTVMFTSPNQEYLLDLCDRQKIIFLISDPYHLMKGKSDDFVLYKIRKIYNKSALILTTSINLKEIYIPKYINKTNNIVSHYWPNTVDIDLWDFEKYQKYKKDSEKSIIGFIGNFMNVTDIDLLNFITKNNPGMHFVLAGNLNFDFSNDIKILLKTIFSRSNVEYIGYIKYNELPKLVMTFDVGLLLDKKTELASYHHHNKLYQYLALGKPVISLNYLNDYYSINAGIYIARNYEEYNNKINTALINYKNNNKINDVLISAKNNSSDKRAEQFIKALEEEFGKY